MKPWTCNKFCTLLVFGTAALVLVLHPVATPAAETQAGVAGLKVDASPPASTLAQKIFNIEAPLDSCSADSYPWRGVLLGSDPYPIPSDVHHFNAYVQINGGPLHYYSTVPGMLTGSLLSPGLLSHFYTRNNTPYTFYATASLDYGNESALSNAAPVSSCFPTNSCTEQTVPVAVAGPDQIVQVNTEVTLDASASHDPYPPDNSSLIYRWVCYSAPVADVTLTADPDNAAIVSFTPTATGRYYFRLTVRDSINGVDSFNRSDIAYLRVSVVAAAPPLLEANAGRTQEVQLGTEVTLDGSQSVASAGATYQWVQVNPVGSSELASVATALGTAGCTDNCYKANFDADGDVDGGDLALLANNWGPIVLASQPVVQFTPNLPGPHIFRLTVSYAGQSSSETAIVGAYHPNLAAVMTPLPVDDSCLHPPI